MGEWGIVGGFGIVVAGGLSPWRFLPSREWSVGERKCIGGFWRYWQYMTVRFLPTRNGPVEDGELLADNIAGR